MIAATAITNVRVFDGERLREPATVVLEDATISARTSADGALNADVVDGGGGTLALADPDPAVRDQAVREAAEIVQAAYREAAGGWVALGTRHR